MELYASIMSWLLCRTSTVGNEVPITKLNIASKDKIIQVDVLQILLGFYDSTNEAQKVIILEDLTELVKENSVILITHNNFYFWLLDVLLEQ